MLKYPNTPLKSAHIEFREVKAIDDNEGHRNYVYIIERQLTKTDIEFSLRRRGGFMVL